MDTTRFPALVGELYRLVAEFEAMFPGRHFTPDGHMVGSLGEAIAAHHYDLELLTASNKGFDAVRRGELVDGTPAPGALQVEIKASGMNPVSQLDFSVHIPADWPARALVWMCSEDAAEFTGTEISLRDEAIRRRVGLI